MTHVVHPYAFRLGELYNWRSRWLAQKNYKDLLRADIAIRQFLEKRLRGKGISGVEIERSPALLNIIIKTAKPGFLIGRGGEGIERLKKEIAGLHVKEKLVTPNDVKINIEEVKIPESSAKVMTEFIAQDLEKRLPFRRVMKKAIEKIMASKENKGVKVALAGRLDGAEMSRREELKKGRMPLQTIRADIDFARERARLPYGDIGIKVWIFKGIR